MESLTPYGMLIDAIDVDDARENIFQILREKGDERVIYFYGWSGLGASAVLRSIAEVLPSRRTTPELCFDRIIHIDCSEWKGRRGLQRAIAEELKLESSVMAILEQDEEDNFSGLDERFRDELPDISRKIHHILKDIRFVVIFHNGSDEETDLTRVGVPFVEKFGSDNAMLWTFSRRLLTIKVFIDLSSSMYELNEKLRYTHLLLYDRIEHLKSGQFYALLCKEAAIIVDRYPCMRGVNPMMVADCCMYKLFLQCSFDMETISDWDDLTSNYWICDGILQENITHEISNALHREISWECADAVLTMLKERIELPFLVVKDYDVDVEGPYRWVSIKSRDSKFCGLQTVHAETSSFLAFQRSDDPQAIPNGLFQHSRNLAVLILCYCAFDFASPPFLKLHSLRFLGLDHCKDDKTGEGEDHTKWACLQSLLVLDLRYTDWNEILSLEKVDLMTNIRELNIEGVICWQYISRLQGRLPNLQRLRVIKPSRGAEISTDTSNSFLDKNKLEIVDLSGNSEMQILPYSLSKASSLQVLVLDGCSGLKNVTVPDGLPRLLKSFSFDGYGPASHWAPTVELPLQHKRLPTVADNKDANISKISLASCTQLENLFLRRLPNLIELDLSRTSIKTLDFETMVLEVPLLKRLFLLGCECLRAIKWRDTGMLELLCIDTRAGTSCLRPSVDQNTTSRLQVHAILLDARLCRSLLCPLRHKCVHFNIHVTSSPVYSGSVQLEAPYKEKKIGMYQVGMLQPVPAGPYSDVHSMVGDAPMLVFPKPPTSNLDRHVEIAQGSRGLESALNWPRQDVGLVDIMKLFAESLHVHDVSIIANMIGDGLNTWNSLRQCRLERCSKLGAVFLLESYGFEELETFWASNLLNAHWIWTARGILSEYSFGNLHRLHLNSCPRLLFVLPVMLSFPSLETLHIIHCGDLKHVFVVQEWHPRDIFTHGAAFPKLTSIHLHDLPMLQQICEVKMLAPELKSIKIRGCWGLRRLLVVGPRSRDVKKPTIEIEKDVWDTLEWDGEVASHHFEAPLHSRYYKKKLPRVSFLR